MDVGQQITIRGPYGNGFPVEGDLKGKDLMFIAGGIGLAPLRSVINYVRANRDNYGTVDVVYGARSAEDLVDIDEIQNEWTKTPGVERTPDHRPRAGRLGRACGLRARLRDGAGLRSQQDGAGLRPAGHDQVHAARR